MRSNVRPAAVELLESRIAPAAVFTFSDVDGDFVTIKTSRGTDAELAAIVTAAATGLGLEVQEIDFSANAGVFAGTNLTVTARRTTAGGDGFANVGYIDATGTDDGAGVDLGSIKIKGDLGRIEAGDATTATFAVKNLKVASMQQFGNSTQGGGASYLSVLAGGVGSLTVTGNIAGASLEATGGADGRFGSVTIGGSLIGAANNETGSIISSGPIGLVKIKGNIEGGGGQGAGAIDSSGTLAGVTIGGSIFGGDGGSAGSIRSTGTMGPIKITGDLVGGSTTNAGAIFSLSNIASISINGSFIGGTGDQGGYIFTNGTLGTMKIGGDLRGGSVEQTGAFTAETINQIIIGGSIIGGTARLSGGVFVDGTIGTIKIGGNLQGSDAGVGESIDDTGAIRASRILSITINGSIIAGTATGGGELINSGSIRVSNDIGAIVVKGSIIGNNTHRVFITAQGSAQPTATSDLAIKSISVGGRVQDTYILAGYSNQDQPVAENPDAQIGAVKVGGDWITSSLVAGVQDDLDDELDEVFGDANDIRIPGGNGSLVSRIASITIKGVALGTVGAADHYGFVAQQIGSLSIAGTRFPLIAGASSAADVTGYLIGATGDLRVREVV
jgi:hypothetical protein